MRRTRLPRDARGHRSRCAAPTCRDRRAAPRVVPHPRVAATTVPDPRPATVPEAQSEPPTTAQPTAAEGPAPEGATTKDRKPKVIDHASAHPSVKAAGLDIAMETEWQQYSDFNAVVACPPDQLASCDDRVIGRSRLSGSSQTNMNTESPSRNPQ